MEAISFGAGVNSTALCILLVDRGWRGHIVFADTGCEMPHTYCYMDYFEKTYLQPRNMEIVRLKGLPYQRYGGGVSLVDYCSRQRIIPLLSIRWCTMHWKIYPLERYAKEHDITTIYLGIAADEAWRQKGRNCPLIEAGIDRKGCVEIIKAAGLEVPLKSGCYICPAQPPAQWRQLWQDHPHLFERAAQLEENAARNPRSKRTNITLDPSGKVTLRQLAERFGSQHNLFNDDEWDKLREHQPCVCGL